MTARATRPDFNHDGNLDLVVADYLNSQVSVLMGNGDGTFQAALSYPTPVGPQFVGVGDFNKDHWPDLIVAEKYTTCECFSVLLNNGDGTFGAAMNTQIPAPYGGVLAVGDFNRDGKLDVAVGGAYGGTSAIQIFVGNGDGTFAPGSYYSLPNATPNWLAVADLRKIGKLDLVIADPYGQSVSVMLGNGDGTFEPEVNYYTVWPFEVAVADFNGDGKLDVVASSNDGPQRIVGVSLLFGNGDGTFQPASFYPVGSQTIPIAIGDFNGDKKPDVAVADRLYSYVTTLLNTGAVSFSPTTPLNFQKVKVGTTSAPLSVTLTNSGKSALTISSMKATGQFGMTSTCGSSVPAGANCSISVTFSPTSTGPKSGTVTIHDSASSKPMVIELSGTGD